MSKAQAVSNPDGWMEETLQQLCVANITYGVVKPGAAPEDGVPFVRGGDFPNGKIEVKNLRTISKKVSDSYKRTKLRGDEILVSLVGYPGSTTLVGSELIGANIARQAAMVRPNNRAHREYLAGFLQSDLGQQRLLSKVMGSAQQVINLRDLKKVRISLPPLPEQRRIAEILGTWDRAITVQEALIRTAEAQKTALMQQLLTPTRRLPGFTDKWKEVRLGDVFERVKTKNKGTSDNALTISAQMGLVSQEDYFNKRVAADNLSNYTLLRQGDFAYNKSYSAGYPMGAIKPLELYDQGVVSTLYICFRLKPSSNSHDYFRHYFEGGFFNREIAAFAQEGARNHGLLNIAIGDFFNGRVKLPSSKEQTAIAEVLAVAEDDISTLSQTLTHLRAEKTALMQQLLTGKRRVRVEETA